MGDGDVGITNWDTQLPEFLQNCIDRLTTEIYRLGLNISIESDFADLSNHLESCSAVVNPSFDPREHDLSEAFWLRVSDPHGETVACHAERIYRSEDFVGDFIETGKLWWNKREPRPGAEWRSIISRPPTQLSGTIAYAGSMLISPPYRGKGLSLILPHLSRSLCLRNYGTHFHTGIVRQGLAGSVIPTANYGFPRMSPIFQGLLPGVKGAFEQVYLCWLTRSEGIERLCELPKHPKFPIPFHNTTATGSPAVRH